MPRQSHAPIPRVPPVTRIRLLRKFIAAPVEPRLSEAISISKSVSARAALAAPPRIVTVTRPLPHAHFTSKGGCHQDEGLPFGSGLLDALQLSSTTIFIILARYSGQHIQSMSLIASNMRAVNPSVRDAICQDVGRSSATTRTCLSSDGLTARARADGKRGLHYGLGT